MGRRKSGITIYNLHKKSSRIGDAQLDAQTRCPDVDGSHHG